MRTPRQIWTGIAAFAAMLVLILDTKTAIAGAREGITLCLFTVIPSLFPFFVLSGLISSCFVGKPIPALRPLGRLCGVPNGAESLLLLGLIGGYPIGAQGVYQAYKSGQLRRADADRMLGFCNNAGPAFIFGMASALFAVPTAPLALFLIHGMSAILTGMLLPKKASAACQIVPAQALTVPQALERGVRTMGNVCGWVVLFRVILTFSQRWFLWLLPPEAQTLLSGILELSNGCVALQAIPLQGTRFLLCTCFLSLGGLCVATQTASVVKDLGMGMYFPGKLLQTAISFLLAAPLQYVLFPRDQVLAVSPLLLCGALSLCCLVHIVLQGRKKVVAIPC